MMRSRLPEMTAALLLATASAASAQIQASPSSRVLEPTNPNAFGQIDFGGRFTGVKGDEARYQRYRDLRDGVFVDVPVYHRETDTWWTDVEIRNGGYRDQRYFVQLVRPGKMDVRFLFDQTPAFISGDTRTPYRDLPKGNGIFDEFSGQFTLPTDVRAIIQNATVNNVVPTGLFRTSMEALAADGLFDTRVRRDTLGFKLVYDIREDIQANVRFTRMRKQGAIPYGASFGFNLAIELPLPIDSATNDFTAGIEWANGRGSFRAGWDGSWYNNDNQVFVWDNPIRISDQTYAAAYTTGNGTSRGRMTTWPTNMLNYFNLAGAVRLPRRSNLNGALSFGFWSQNEALVPHTINTAIAVIPLERTSAEAKADTVAMTLNFVTRPSRAFDVNARYRLYRFDNTTPEFQIFRPENPAAEYVRLDQVEEPWSNPALHKVGPEFFGYTRNYVDVDAAYTAIPYTSFGVGWGHYDASQKFRVFDDIRENTLRLTGDVIGNPFFTLRGRYEYSRRRGDGIEDINRNNYPDVLENVGEQPGMRHFDIASRDRNRFTVVGNVMPRDSFGINASIAWTNEDYLNEEQPANNAFGLQDYRSQAYTVGFDYLPLSAVNVGASYSYEKYDGLTQSRNASPGAQFTDPARNWSVDENQKAQSFLVNLDLLKLMTDTEVRLGYNYSKYNGVYDYGLAGGYRPSPMVPDGVAQLPDIDSDEHRFNVDFRYFLRKNVAVGFVYWFDKYTIDDWALGPREAIIGAIAQPPVTDLQGPLPAVTGILLNYLYRNYTSHTGWLRLTYAF